MLVVTGLLGCLEHLLLLYIATSITVQHETFPNRTKDFHVIYSLVLGVLHCKLDAVARDLHLLWRFCGKCPSPTPRLGMMSADRC